MPSTTSQRSKRKELPQRGATANSSFEVTAKAGRRDRFSRLARSTVSMQQLPKNPFNAPRLDKQAMIQSFKEAFAKSPIARKAPEIEAEDFINGKRKSFVINLDQPDNNEK